MRMRLYFDLYLHVQLGVRLMFAIKLHLTSIADEMTTHVALGAEVHLCVMIGMC